MGRLDFVFTSESVTEGHPDKMCDRVSDSILDAILSQDPTARVACETALTTGLALVCGEVTTTARVDYREVIRQTIRDIGFTSSDMGYDAETCSVLLSLGTQSPDIAQGVNSGEGLFKEQGAGDQGLMFGYAIDETAELMPMPIMLSHKLTEKLAEVRKRGVLDFVRPDGKSQVSVRYENGVPVAIDAIVVSTQHSPDVSHEEVRQGITDHVINPIIPSHLINDQTKVYVNPTGKFVVGGPMGDAGLTGRKIIVDTYGGWARHGGGAFSGKDPSKVDRSAAYFTRYAAKNVVAAGLAKRCEIQVAYAIGIAQPVSVLVDTFGTGVMPDDQIANVVREVFDFRPRAIIETLNLLRPIYTATSAYGHFGRNLPDFTWEKTDRTDDLRSLAERAA
jgi:S-adenosylmethionine synthetase